MIQWTVDQSSFLFNNSLSECIDDALHFMARNFKVLNILKKSLFYDGIAMIYHKPVVLFPLRRMKESESLSQEVQRTCNLRLSRSDILNSSINILLLENWILIIINLDRLVIRSFYERIPH